eukprot:12926916-Prorocentrum_lima.AAC.1
MFQKQDRELLTQREIGTGSDPPYQRGRYDTLDCIMVSGRWRNSVQDAHADFDAGVYSGTGTQ